MVAKADCIRIVIAGEEGVGKSAIAVRLLTQRFIGEYQNNEEMVYKKQLVLEEDSGASVKLELLDTLGAQLENVENANPALERLHWSSATVIVYSVTNLESFKSAKSMLKLIKKEKPSQPCLLLANKSDLSHSRAVSAQEGCNATLPYGRCKFTEVSAAEDAHQILDSFQSFIRENILTNRRSSAPTKRRKSIVKMARAVTTMLKNRNSHQAPIEK